MSLNWTEKPKVVDAGQIYYIGEIIFPTEPAKSKAGSEYHLMRMTAAPADGQAGVSAATNFMVDPSWLESDFHPSQLKQDDIDVQSARAARKAGHALSEEQQRIIQVAGQDFVFGRNVGGPRSILRNLFDDSQYEELLGEATDMDPLDFLKLVADTWNGLDDKPVTIIQAQQTIDQEGDLSSRFEILEVVSIRNDTDLENFNNYHSKKARLLFDSDSV